MTENGQASAVRKRENLLLSVVCNIAIPLLILTKLSSPERLGPVVALCVGLAFPLCYGFWDLINRKTIEFYFHVGYSKCGLERQHSGLVQIDPFWLAVKEASLPFVIGIMVLLTFRRQEAID